MNSYRTETLPFGSSHFLFFWDAAFLQSDLKTCMKYLLEIALDVGTGTLFGKHTYVKTEDTVTVN